MKAKPVPSEARFAYEGLDRVIHERARLERAHLADQQSQRIDLRRSQAAVCAD